MHPQQKDLAEDFVSFLSNDAFPCVAARDAISKGNIAIFTAAHIGCPADDQNILSFIYSFTEHFRKSEKGFYSAAVIFNQQDELPEPVFDRLMWQRLQSLRNLDERNYQYDERVDEDPASPQFSFSLMQEAFFIIGLHPGSSRPARQFKYPALIFNPHVQFDELRKNERYDKMKSIVRKRDLAFSGSVNPMLTDFGERSEAYQYSGRNYSDESQCPVHQFKTNEHH